MAAITLSLTGFRRFSELTTTLDETTILVGPNGVGKTTILEALYYLSLGRSYRTTHDRDLVNWETDTFRLVGQFPAARAGSGGVTIERATSFPIGTLPRKRVTANGVDRSFVASLGLVRVVLFAPELIALITGAPRERRRYLDAILASLSQRYAADLLAYQHALRQRNALLASVRQPDAAAYEPWEAALAQYGTAILTARAAFSTFLNRYVPEAYVSLVPPSGVRVMSVAYQGTVEDPARFADLLAARRERDRLLRATSVGPHRDDLLFQADGRLAAQTTSRGEQRTLLLALKQAEIAYLLETPAGETGYGPILLLDDMFSELDAARARQLARVVGTHQCLITTTDRTSLPQALAQQATLLAMEEVLRAPAIAR
ncbi:DNA replication and repair protein RecF [Candidatus Berkelbacteria bacterium]|nr:DNA replication and repair protein RecF [Candidatus Berkelbacteria bacterium]